MRRVFVTGAHGLLGSWLVKALLARGAHVVVLKRDSVRASALELEGSEARCTVVHGDLADAAALERAVAEHACDTVFHLASQPIVATAKCSPVATFEANVRGTWNVMEACRLHAVERVVVAASEKVYGQHAALPYREDHELRAQAPYDVSKACADLLARSYFHTYGVRVAVTRFANTYGGGDLNATRLVPELVAAVERGRAPVIRSDGCPQRDFLYVEDAAAAYLAIADALGQDGAAGEAFNAGGPRLQAVSDVVATLLEVSGSPLTPEYRGLATGGLDRQWVDSGKLTALTGWRPRVELREGLQRTVDW